MPQQPPTQVVPYFLWMPKTFLAKTFGSSVCNSSQWSSSSGERAEVLHKKPCRRLLIYSWSLQWEMQLSSTVAWTQLTLMLTGSRPGTAASICFMASSRGVPSKTQPVGRTTKLTIYGRPVSLIRRTRPLASSTEGMVTELMKSGPAAASASTWGRW